VDYSGSRWFWTIASFGICHGCGSHVERAIIAYESERRIVYCGNCADAAGIAAECVESRRARRARHRRLIEEAEVRGEAR